MTIPFQNALKFPATIPERIAKEAPPSRAAVTISLTCLDLAEVKILVNSGINAAAAVPQLIIVASCHHKFVPKSLRSKKLTPYVTAIDTKEVIHTKEVRGASKLN